MRNPSAVAELAHRTIDVLQERGHTKGIYEELDGKVCFIGAMRIASGVDPGELPLIGSEVDAVYHTLWLVVEEIIGNEDSISSWNDQPETTVEDVILILKHAKERAMAYAILEA